MLNWLSAIIGFFYIALGIYIITNHFFVVELEPNVAYPLGAVMSAYGLLRVYRGFKKLREKDEG